MNDEELIELLYQNLTEYIQLNTGECTDVEIRYNINGMFDFDSVMFEEDFDNPLIHFYKNGREVEINIVDALSEFYSE